MTTTATSLVDFHLPLPWYLDIIPETSQMVDNSPMTEGQVALAEAIASLLGAALQQYDAEVLYPGDRWLAWGTPAGRGRMRRFTLRLPEARMQEFARGARIIAEQVAAGQERAVVVTRAGDESAVLALSAGSSMSPSPQAPGSLPHWMGARRRAQ